MSQTIKFNYIYRLVLKIKLIHRLLTPVLFSPLKRLTKSDCHPIERVEGTIMIL